MKKYPTQASGKSHKAGSKNKPATTEKKVPKLKERMEEYAALLIKRGVNLKPGQTLILSAPLEGAEFAHICMRKAFEAGAKDVIVKWADNTGGEIRMRHASLETIKEVPAWVAASYNDYANADALFLALDTEFPPPVGLDPAKLGASRVARMQATQEFSDARMKGIVRWNIASVPTLPWASLVYPELSAKKGLEALWHDVLTCTRSLEGDPIEQWDTHVKRNNVYRDKLNQSNFKELHFKNKLGTDLVLGLPDGYHFAGSQETGADGTLYIANMPSEEIFSAPHRERVNGTVVASKPLFYNNVLVEGLKFTFKDGKVVDYSADTGAEIIEHLLNTDDGSRYLGEVALVPFDSTVQNTGKLFFTTLYDENAACHLALGESYPESLDGGMTMTKEELLEHGMNQSLEHVDFMFGTADMAITGVTHDGKEIAFYKKGNWAW